MPCGLVVLVQKQPQAIVMHRVGLRGRERLPNKANQVLTQNVVEALHRAGRAFALACAPCCSLGSTSASAAQKSVQSRPAL